LDLAEEERRRQLKNELETKNQKESMFNK
jgi:hypothetical protein